MTHPKRPDRKQAPASCNHTTPQAQVSAEALKSSKKSPTTTDDLRATRMEVDSFRQKISDLIHSKPEKAAIIVTEMLDRSRGSAHRRKKAA